MTEEQKEQQEGQQQEQQQQAPPPPPASGGGEKSTLNLDSNVAGLLCYLGLWITGLIFFLIEKENSFVRFHAMQSLLAFASLGVISIVANVIPILGQLIALAAWVLGLVIWIMMMVKAYGGERYKLPIVGDMAEKYI